MRGWSDAGDTLEQIQAKIDRLQAQYDALIERGEDAKIAAFNLLWAERQTVIDRINTELAAALPGVEIEFSMLYPHGPEWWVAGSPGNLIGMILANEFYCDFHGIMDATVLVEDAANIFKLYWASMKATDAAVAAADAAGEKFMIYFDGASQL